MTFNPRLELRKLIEANKYAAYRKLSFRRQCAAFAALYDGVRPAVVARTFRISPQTVSHIGGCLENDPDPYRTVFDPATDLAAGREYHDHNAARSPSRRRHYPIVAREFEALGADEFMRRYLTPDILADIAEATREIEALKQGQIPAQSQRRGPRYADEDGFPVDEDGDPDFGRMSNKQTLAWRELNPERWAEINARIEKRLNPKDDEQ
jgi:hypothetical protein